MTEVRIVVRWLLLVTAAFALCACATQPRSGGNPCAAGAGKQDLEAPIVCVDDTGAVLRVDPDPIVVRDRTAQAQAPVVIQWWTRSGRGALGIEARETGCVTEIQCRDDHCTARTLPVPEAQGNWMRCKYDVWTNENNRLDPDIVVTECCRR